jgi:hypothetical protein
MKKYKASLDKLALVVTIGVILLLLFGSYTSVKGILNAGVTGSGKGVHVIALVVFVLLVLGTWLFAPSGYSVDGTSLRILRPASKKSIPLNEIESVRAIEKAEMRGSIRTFGVGGMFGYYGKFSAPQLGNLQMYATQMRNLVLVKLHTGKLIVLSPDDLNFVNDLQRLIRPRRN